MIVAKHLTLTAGLIFRTKDNFGVPSFMILRLKHVALAAKKLELFKPFFGEALKLDLSRRKCQHEHGVATSFINFSGSSTSIELMEPIGEKSPIIKSVENSPLGVLHHVCFEVDNIDSTIKELRAKNIRFLSEGHKIGAHGLPVIFIHPKDSHGILVELEEAPKVQMINN